MENSYTASNNQRRRLALVVVVIFFLLLSWLLISYFQHRGLVKTTVLALPSDSKITIDGVNKKAGTIYLKPGVHTLVASRQYFDGDVEKIDTKDIISSEKIYLLPQANSEQARQWLEQHPDVQQQREVAGGAMAIRRQRIISADYPIVNQLPYENEHFKIDYSLSSEGKPQFVITLFGIINRPSQYNEYVQQLKQYKQEALKYLQDNKINPKAYKITYVPNDPGQ